MKLTRKLIPAFAMLLVSAVLMSTASFAWFSMNENVTASGINVTATAPAALWISTDGSNWQTTIEMDEILPDGTTRAATIAPLTTKPAADDDSNPENWTNNYDAWVFYKLTEAAQKKVLANGVVGTQDEEGEITVEDLVFPGEGVTNANLAVDASTINYYKTIFHLLYEGDASESTAVNVQVKVSKNDEKDGTDNIWKAMRIALVANNAGAPVIFTPNKLGDWTVEGSATSTTVYAPELFTISGNDATEVAVYVWFEGTDEFCANKYSAIENVWSIELKFT